MDTDEGTVLEESVNPEVTTGDSCSGGESSESGMAVDPVPVEHKELRRSTRARQPPSWIKGGEYVMSQVVPPKPAPRARPRPKPRKLKFDYGQRDNIPEGQDQSWTLRERVNLLRLLSAQGAFTDVPENVSQGIWKSIVDT
jgi:hypothetical protein